MSMDFMAAMRRATEATRALDVASATRVIREALGSGTRPEAAAPPPPSGAGRPADVIEDAEILDAAPPRPSARPRRPLGEVVRRLREGRFALPGLMETPGSRPTPPPPVAPGASFTWRHYACAADSREYRLYVPATAAQGVAGLIVMLHGCTQNPDDFALGTRMNALAERHRLVVAYPGQGARHNPKGCWNWFRPEDQERGAGEPAIIAGLAAALAAEFGVPASRVFVAGLSAGGAMAAVLGETYPEIFAAVGVHSGLARGAASDVVSAFAAMRRAPAATARPAKAPRTIVFHGDADQTVHSSNAEQVVARAAGTGAGGERGTVDAPGGRSTARTIVRRRDGSTQAELWLVAGAGHAWSGGNAAGSYADPSGPDASAEMIRFFLVG